MTGIRKTTLLPTIAVGLLMIAAVCCADAAVGVGTGTSDKIVTLQAVNTPVIDAIDKLFSQAGYKYTIQPGVSGSITLRLSNVKFTDALKSLADGANLNYRVSGGRYVISAKPKPKIAVAAVAVTGPASTVTGALPAGQSAAQTLDNGPVYYGSMAPQQAQPYQYPIGAGSLIVLPNGNSVYITGASGAHPVNGGSIMDENPAGFNDSGWARFRTMTQQFDALFPPAF